MTGWLTVCSDYGGLRAWLQRRCDWGRELLPGLGDVPPCHLCCSYGNRERALPVSVCTLQPSRRACLSPSPSWSAPVQRLQMCTNKGGLKQNESKQTNGIRVMGVGGLVHCDKHNDAVYVCVSRGLSVVRCVVCVWLCDCFWVSLCVCLSVYVFVIICVCIYPVSLPVCFIRCPTKLSPCALYVCVCVCYVSLCPPPQPPRCSGVRVPLVFLFRSVCVCVCIEDTCVDSKVLLFRP